MQAIISLKQINVLIMFLLYSSTAKQYRTKALHLMVLVHQGGCGGELLGSLSTDLNHSHANVREGLFIKNLKKNERIMTTVKMRREGGIQEQLLIKARMK